MDFFKPDLLILLSNKSGKYVCLPIYIFKPRDWLKTEKAQ